MALRSDRDEEGEVLAFIFRWQIASLVLPSSSVSGETGWNWGLFSPNIFCVFRSRRKRQVHRSLALFSFFILLDYSVFGFTLGCKTKVKGKGQIRKLGLESQPKLGCALDDLGSAGFTSLLPTLVLETWLRQGGGGPTGPQRERRQAGDRRWCCCWCSGLAHAVWETASLTGSP